MASGSSLPSRAAEAHGVQLKEWIAIEPRVKALAGRFERRADWLRRRGAPMAGISTEDLIQHAWLCLTDDKPPFKPERQTLFKYMQRRIEDEFKRVSRLSENLVSHDYMFMSDSISVKDGKVIQLRDARDERNAIEARRTIQEVLAWLQRHHPELLPIAQLIAVHRIIDPAEQARALGIPIRAAYRLRRRLKRAAIRFSKMTPGA
jgi:hypothetical protein